MKFREIDERREREEFTCAPDTGGRESAGVKADYFVYVFDRGNAEVGKGGDWWLSVMVRNVTQVSN
jgi:hypothetical protein